MTDRQNFQYDVFLSHNNAQKDWTRALARRLRDDGFRVFFDEWEMPRYLGKTWITVLGESIERTKQVVLIWSPDFFKHDWPLFEGQIIQSLDPVGHKGRLLPLIYTDCDIPRHWAILQGLPFQAAQPGSLEFDFRYQQLLYNLDKSRPYEGDFERFKAQRADGKKSGVVPPVAPLPKGSRMPHAHSPLFVGRDQELLNLARLLVPGAQGMVGVHATVTGMGGVGKTQLAIEYAHRYGNLYPGGVFWLNMEKAEEAINEVARCGGPEGLKLPDFDKMNAPDQAATVHKTWEDGEASLLVFDNAEEPGVVERWRPKTGRCSVLITSRRPEWPPEMGVQPIALETLPREKSLEMLSEARAAIAREKAEKDAAEKVCDRLGDLPLALSVAAAYLRKYKSEKVSQYLDALSKQPAIENESLKKVGESFSVSYNKLNPKDETEALAMRVFHLASHFAPVSINRELLAASAKLNPQETEQMHQFEDALARLTDLGLMREEEDEEGRVSLHRLLREFARLRPPEGLTTGEGREAVAQALLDFANREIDTGLPQKLSRERPHLREAAIEAEQAGVASAARLYNALGFHGRMVALFQEAKADYKRAVALGEAASGNENSEVATYVNNLGRVLWELGDMEGAKASFERALKIDERVYGPDHPKVAIRVNNQLPTAFRVASDN